MRIHSFFSTQRWAVLALGCSFVIAFTHACGGKVIADGRSLGAGGGGGKGGAGGAGGGFSDGCEGFGGPLTPDGCKTDGAQCFFADTSCSQSWTCNSGKWSESGGCFGTATGGG